MYAKSNNTSRDFKNIATKIVAALTSLQINANDKGAIAAQSMQELFSAALKRDNLKTAAYPFTKEISRVFDGDEDDKNGNRNLRAEFINKLLQNFKIEPINTVEALKTRTQAIFTLIYDALFQENGEVHPSIASLFEHIQKSDASAISKPSSQEIFQAILTMFTTHFSKHTDKDFYLNFVILGQLKLEQQTDFSKSALQKFVNDRFNSYIEDNKDENFYLNSFLSKVPDALQSFHAEPNNASVKDLVAEDTQKKESSLNNDPQNLIKEVFSLRSQLKVLVLKEFSGFVEHLFSKDGKYLNLSDDQKISRFSTMKEIFLKKLEGQGRLVSNKDKKSVNKYLDDIYKVYISNDRSALQKEKVELENKNKENAEKQEQGKKEKLKEEKQKFEREQELRQEELRQEKQRLEKEQKLKEEEEKKRKDHESEREKWKGIIMLDGNIPFDIDNPEHITKFAQQVNKKNKKNKPVSMNNGNDLPAPTDSTDTADKNLSDSDKEPSHSSSESSSISLDKSSDISTGFSTSEIDADTDTSKSSASSAATPPDSEEAFNQLHMYWLSELEFAWSEGNETDLQSLLKDFSESNPNFKDSKYIMLKIAAFEFNDKRVNNEKLEKFFSILNNIFPDITVKNFFESFAQDLTSLVLSDSMWPIGAKTWIIKESSIFYENERKYFEKLLTENKPFTKEDKNRLMDTDRDGNTLVHHVAKKRDRVFYQKLVNQIDSSVFYEHERKYFEKLLTENKPFTKEDKNRLMDTDRDGNTLVHHVAKKRDRVFYQKLVNQIDSSVFYEHERKYFEKLLTENKPFTKEDKNRLMYPDRDGNTLAHHVAKKGDMVFYQKLVNQLDGREGGYFHTKNAKAETAFQLRPMVKCERNALIGTIAAASITAGLAIGTLFLAAGLGGPFGVAIWALAWGGAALIGSAAVGSLYDKFLTPFRSTEPDNKSPAPSIIPA